MVLCRQGTCHPSPVYMQHLPRGTSRHSTSMCHTRCCCCHHHSAVRGVSACPRPVQPPVSGWRHSASDLRSASCCHSGHSRRLLVGHTNTQRSSRMLCCGTEQELIHCCRCNIAGPLKHGRHLARGLGLLVMQARPQNPRPPQTPPPPNNNKTQTRVLHIRPQAITAQTATHLFLYQRGVICCCT